MLDLFDLSSDKANVPVDVVFINPITKEPTDLVFQVVGTDSSAAQACLDAQQAARFNKLMSDGEQGSQQTPQFDPKEGRVGTIQLLVACTVGWRNLQWQGSDLPFSPDNAAMVYDKVPAIREQLDKAVGDRKRFFSN